MASSQTGQALDVSEEGTREVGVGCESRSFLHPTGVSARTSPPKMLHPVMELVVFFVFVLVRAAHPVIIEKSKSELEDGSTYFLYQTSSTIIVMTVVMCMLSLIFCCIIGGKAQFMTIWERKPFLIFSINGIVYALGDYLEMEAIGSLPAAAYQILQQSRILLTALLMVPAKKLYQTRLQWTLLAILTFAMSTYMIITTKQAVKDREISGRGSGTDVVEPTDANIALATIMKGSVLAFLKVLISSLGAVISDRYMKVCDIDPTHVCIARTFIARAVAIVCLSFAQDVWTKGFFDGWDAMTIAVTGSFIVKSVSTLYMVALLDSILKNVAEAYAVLVIYAHDVFSPWGPHKKFHVATCLSVLVIVAACSAYVDSKSSIDKARRWDRLVQRKEGNLRSFSPA